MAEYCLISALVALIGLAIFVHISGGVQAVWGSANTTLAQNNGTNPSSGTTPATSSTPANPSR